MLHLNPFCYACGDEHMWARACMFLITRRPYIHDIENQAVACVQHRLWFPDRAAMRRLREARRPPNQCEKTVPENAIGWLPVVVPT